MTAHVISKVAAKRLSIFRMPFNPANSIFFSFALLYLDKYPALQFFALILSQTTFSLGAGDALNFSQKLQRMDSVSSFLMFNAMNVTLVLPFYFIGVDYKKGWGFIAAFLA